MEISYLSAIAITSVIVFFAFAALARAGSRPSHADGSSGGVLLLKHGRFVRWVIPLVCLVFGVPMALLALGMLMSGNVDRGAMVGTVGSATILFGCCFLAWHESRRTIQADHDTVRMFRGTRCVRSVSWDDVRWVRFAFFSYSVVLIGRHGGRVPVCMFLQGFDDFVRLIRARIGQGASRDALKQVHNVRRFYRR